LLKIKHLQQGIKQHLTKLLDDLPNREEVRFGDKEQLSSRAVVQRQVRFPKIPKKKHHTNRLRAPSSEQAAAIKSNLGVADSDSNHLELVEPDATFADGLGKDTI
jgi:hypothetical protein